MTVDSRTTRTNYNVADNTVGAHELWLRGGFELAVTPDITVKNQAYEYGARRHWYDSETYAFNPNTSFLTVIMALLGGATSVWGPMLGVIPLVLISDYLSVTVPCDDTGVRVRPSGMGFTFLVSVTRVSPSHQATVSPSQGRITAGW